MKYFFSLILLFSISISYAQPENDDCSAVIDLGVAPFCTDSIYTNINATPTDVGNDNSPGCFISNPPQNDVWFSFVTDNAVVDYTVTVTGTDLDGNDALSNIQFAIYRGFCSENTLFLNNCATGSVGDQVVELDLINLTPNELYYIRVDNYGDQNAEGDFHLCVEEKAPDNTIDEEFSDACTGTLYDTGGPDGNYGDNEDFTFVICPQEFHQCIEFNFEYYNLEDNSDIIEFFNGPDINSTPIDAIDGGGNGDNWGGVCYTVRADSCLTIHFTSDASINFEGFKGDWTCSFSDCKEEEIISVSSGASYEEIEQAISSELSTVIIDTIICDSTSYATFSNAEDTDLGLGKGLILSSGQASDVSNVGNIFASSGVGGFGDGDADLDELSFLEGNNNLSEDACVVEVDVTVYTDKLEFEYIFGSEEYPEFVNSQFNDIFALLISGPGIVGIPEINNQQNMAIIPGTETNITINSLNNIVNWEYYRDNLEGPSIVYDGLTSGFLGNKKSLTAVADVIPCSTYHLKFAIADRGDSAFDSGVFIAEIRSGTPDITAKFSSGLDYFVEKCIGETTDSILLTLSDVVDDTQVYTVVVSGTAIDPDDYNLEIPDTIIFEPGQIQHTFPIQVFDDEITEGDETIIITLFRNFGCGDIEVVSVEIFIRENIKVEIEAEQDSIIVCAGNSVQVSASGANHYTWTPFTIFNDPFISNPVVEDGYTGWIYVEGKIDPFTSPECIGYDSIYIESINPLVTIETDDPLEMCFGDTITLTAVNNVNDMNIVWNYNFGIVESPGEAVTDVIPPFGFVGFPQTVTVTIALGGCIATDMIEFNVDPFSEVFPLFQDTIICQGSSVLMNQLDFSFDGTTYDWTPTDYLEDPTIPWTISTPSEDIEYELIVSSPSGFCADTLNYSIEILPNEINIEGDDEIRLCLGDTLDLSALFLPADANVTWSPDEFITVTNGGETQAFPNVTTMFFVESDNGICSSKDSIIIYVDSLPAMPISAIPERNPYCKGDVITFVSPAYKSYQFPLMEHNWNPTIGIFDIDTYEDFNIALGAVETTTYIRTSTNGACSVMDSIYIRVIDPSLDLNLPDTTVCVGEDVIIGYTASGELEEIEWSANNGGDLSCDACPETTLQDVQQNTLVELMAEIEGCPVSGDAVIEVIGYNGDITVLPEIDSCYFYGETVDMLANIFPTAPDGSQLTWFFEETEIEGINGNPVSVTLPGNGKNKKTLYNYQWRIVDPMGCTGNGGVDICLQERFIMPDAFSPNNDDLNDVFRIVDFGMGENITIDVFSIYNRWGQKVFDCDNFECATMTGWNGKFNNVDQPGGVYVYYVKLVFADGSSKKYEGDLLLLR